MKKTSFLTLALLLMISILAACGGGGMPNPETGTTTGTGTTETGTDTTEPATGTDAPASDVTLKMFQFKVEIADAMEKLLAEYKKETGVTITIETVGGGADYGAALKAKFASGDEPDIFNNGGYNEAQLWKDRMEDLSDQPWVADLSDNVKDPMTMDGKLYGLPMNIEGYGFLYNKALFEQAGITEIPTTLTELRAAAQKLQDAGIVPFENGYQEWWVIGQHLVNGAYAKQDDPDKFIADWREGKTSVVDNEIFNEWINLVDLTMEFSNDRPLTTDYNTQMTEFASGMAAMTQQGNWTQVQIDGIDPELQVGVLPMPINDDEALNDNIFVGVPNNWVVNKNSANKEEAKKFLEWMVTSETGKRYTVEEFKFIPALKTITYEPEQLGTIAASIQEYVQADKTLGWQWPKLPDGTSQEFGALMQAYVAKKITKEELFKQMDETVLKLAAK
ncbi:ABC transporter substrate-binding protein [Saccharibacillus sacchari]|uniref:ABC transporter substrate-binding protein n=1 Tax=Saccharibacillus sacchari TaxID=456493 RepID=UPI0004BC8F38|nr:extracellular solute-binding protein [Saccharibacillus sacchari]